MREKVKKSLVISILFFVGFVISVLLHNFLSGTIGQEEIVFFILSMAFGLLFPISVLVNVFLWFFPKPRKPSQDKEEKDLEDKPSERVKN